MVCLPRMAAILAMFSVLLPGQASTRASPLTMASATASHPA